jgi:integrase
LLLARPLQGGDTGSNPVGTTHFPPDLRFPILPPHGPHTGGSARCHGSRNAGTAGSFAVRRTARSRRATSTTRAKPATTPAWASRSQSRQPGSSTNCKSRRESRKKRSPKLGDYALEVIAHDTNIGQGSRDAYAATIRNHVVDSVIDVPITDVEPAMVRRFYSGLRPTKNYAAAGNGMRSSVIRVLSKVFKQAVDDGIIPSSPLSRSGVKRPSKRRSVPIQAMSIDDIEELADCAPSTRNHLAILLAGLCGLRAGEVGGLPVRDVDFSKCRLSVSQAVYRDRTGRHVGAPKTAASRRTITIQCSLSKELAKFVKGKPRGDLIFQTEVGGLVDHVVLGKWVKQAAKACGIEGPHPPAAPRLRLAADRLGREPAPGAAVPWPLRHRDDAGDVRPPLRLRRDRPGRPDGGTAAGLPEARLTA